MKKKLLIFLSLLVIITIGWLWKYFHSPEYALKQINDAFISHDLVKLEKYADLDNIAENLIKQNNEYDSAAPSENEWEAFGKMIGKTISGFLTSQIRGAIAASLREYIQKGSIEKKEEMDFSFSPLLTEENLKKTFAEEDTDFKGFSHIYTEENQATLGLEFYYKKYDTTLVLELKMIKQKGKWKLTEIKNLIQFLNWLDALRKKRD